MSPSNTPDHPRVCQRCGVNRPVWDHTCSTCLDAEDENLGHRRNRPPDSPLTGDIYVSSRGRHHVFTGEEWVHVNGTEPEAGTMTTSGEIEVRCPHCDMHVTYPEYASGDAPCPRCGLGRYETITTRTRQGYSELTPRVCQRCGQLPPRADGFCIRCTRELARVGSPVIVPEVPDTDTPNVTIEDISTRRFSNLTSTRTYQRLGVAVQETTLPELLQDLSTNIAVPAHLLSGLSAPAYVHRIESLHIRRVHWTCPACGRAHTWEDPTGAPYPRQVECTCGGQFHLDTSRLRQESEVTQERIEALSARLAQSISNNFDRLVTESTTAVLTYRCPACEFQCEARQYQNNANRCPHCLRSEAEARRAREDGSLHWYTCTRCTTRISAEEFVGARYACPHCGSPWGAIEKEKKDSPRPARPGERKLRLGEGNQE